MTEYKRHFPMVKRGEVVKHQGYICKQSGYEQMWTLEASKVTCNKCLVRLSKVKLNVLG